MDNEQIPTNNATSNLSEDLDSHCAVNSSILDYYKKFGKKRDLEQFFSLSTAQGDIKDTSGLFWRRMKSENDSSDSGGRKSDSSGRELCRISIKCSMPEESSSQSEDPKSKAQSALTESPPIITDDIPVNISRQTDDESFKSDDNHSQKSFDPLLDLSAHKPVSPTSSITSQRKLEWDSLADVGYAYESDRKTSASSLSTLERLALKQQYSNNDTNQDIGHPTSHSTPVEENEVKAKMKRNSSRKVTKIFKKDVDFLEVNVPHTSDVNPRQSINVNLTKHISFNVEKDGGISFDNMRKDISVSPEKATKEEASQLPKDKEIQTSLPRTKQKLSSPVEEVKSVDTNSQKIPVMISLNTLRRKLRMKKTRAVRRRRRIKIQVNKNVPAQEKSGEQVSEAESFEYMPGHIYNQNQMKANENNEARLEHNNTAGNKSSLESSCGLTTDSSKGSKHSLTQDLEKCINVLKVTLQKRYDDSETKKKLIKDIVHKLLSSKYRDDDTSTEFLSGLSYNSKIIDLKQTNTMTSTSDANNTDESKENRPKKSILRREKFDSNTVASTSQSAPNLSTAVVDENVFAKPSKVLTSYSESDGSSKGKTSSENALPKTSSEKLYMMYLEALRREESYKRHLRDKEIFLKQKLGSTEGHSLRTVSPQEVKINNRLKDLMKDLTRNNYDDGSGDASKLEGGSTSERNLEHPIRGGRSQRSHSVFTLSSSQSENQKRPNLKKTMQVDRDLEAGTSNKHHFCCCPFHCIDSHAARAGYTDSSVQVNIKGQSYNEGEQRQDRSAKFSHCGYSARVECQCKGKFTPKDDNKCSKCAKISIHDSHNHRSPRNTLNTVQNKQQTYFCVCHNDNPMSLNNMKDCRSHEYSTSAVRNPSEHSGGSRKNSEEDGFQFLRMPKVDIATDSSKSDNTSKARKCSQCSQTNMSINMLSERSSGSKPLNFCTNASKNTIDSITRSNNVICEATRCLQTEISINPQISDPTLSDIVVVDHCGELISEQLRQVATSNTNNSDEKKSFSDVYTISESRKFLLSTNGDFAQSKPKHIGISIADSRESNLDPTKKNPNDYTIPIEGTNMNLVVSLASNELNDNKERVHQAVGTEKPPIADQGTCIAIECAKSAQCQASTTANSTRTAAASEHSSRNSSLIGKQRKYFSFKPSSKGSPQRNTYPKELQSKEIKPFLRSNTDTDKIKTCCIGFQTEPLNKINCCDGAKQLTNKVDTSKSPDDLPDFKKNIRLGNAEDDRLPIKVDIGIQKDLSGEIIETTTPAMISTGVGSDVVLERAIDLVDKKINTKCDTGNYIHNKCSESNCGKTRLEECEADSKLNSSKCSKYGEDGCDDERCCSTTIQNAGLKTAEQGRSRYETLRSKRRQVEENSLRETKGDTVSKKSSCEKCGSTDECRCASDSNGCKDPIINMVKDITRRYSKTDIMKIKKKKCFTEIITVLNYLLETDESTDQEPQGASATPDTSDNYDTKLARSKSPTSDDKNTKSFPQSSKSTIDKNANLRLHQSPKSTKRDDKKCLKLKPSCCNNSKKIVVRSESESCHCKNTKSGELTSKCTSKDCTESSDLPGSTDVPSTSDSTACKILRKIRKECEKYHLKRTKCGRKCEISSSTSVNCDQCKKIHHCGCKHKCKRSKTTEKLQKKCVAYNLILQTSESMLSEGTSCDKSRPLKNVFVKVPKCKDKLRADVCKETLYRMEKGYRLHGSPRGQRSRSCPRESEMSSTDDFIRRTHQCTVREYLEKNRPDFLSKCAERQTCLKYINEMRATERAVHRDLLSMQLQREPDLTSLSSEQLRDLAQQIGVDMRRKKMAPKFINEREMKTHSKNIYKTLPEVVQKKEEKKKENIKKTNLLMANLFKKNLQKNTLRGAVNISNYKSVIKI